MAGTPGVGNPGTGGDPMARRCAGRRSARRMSAVAVATFFGGALGSVGGSAVATAATSTTTAGPPTKTVVFDQSGVFHWKVPAGVFSATFDLTGAAGGGSAGGS